MVEVADLRMLSRITNVRNTILLDNCNCCAIASWQVGKTKLYMKTWYSIEVLDTSNMDHILHFNFNFLTYQFFRQVPIFVNVEQSHYNGTFLRK